MGYTQEAREESRMMRSSMYFIREISWLFFLNFLFFFFWFHSLSWTNHFANLDIIIIIDDRVVIILKC